MNTNPFFEMTGYEPKTTFWQDFSIADSFGLPAVKDTYKRAFSEWKDNATYVAELVMVLNHKSWQWDDKNNDLSELYADLYYKADNWCMENLAGDDLQYYLRTID